MFAKETTSKRKLTCVRITSVTRGNNYTLTQAWESAIEGWQGWMRLAGLSPSTVRLRRDHVRAIVRRSRTAAPKDLTLGILIQTCAARNQSNEHRRGVRCSFISFCEWCVRNDLMAVNIGLLMPPVKAPPPQPRPVTDAIWAQVLATAKPRELMMARLASEAGLRRAEVAKCHRDDLIADADRWALIVHGKGGKQRVVPVTDSLAQAIQAWCVGGFLFPSPDGGHLTAQYVGLLISRLMPDTWSMHKLRHRAASRGFAGTQNLLAVQKFLGHASVATTQRYVAISSREVRSVSEAAGA